MQDIYWMCFWRNWSEIRYFLELLPFLGSQELSIAESHFGYFLSLIKYFRVVMQVVPWMMQSCGNFNIPPLNQNMSEFAGGIHDAHIPPEHKLKRLDLPRHTEVAMGTGADHIEGVALNLLAPLRPQPRRPPRPRDRQDFQNRQGEFAYRLQSLEASFSFMIL